MIEQRLRKTFSKFHRARLARKFPHGFLISFRKSSSLFGRRAKPMNGPPPAGNSPSARKIGKARESFPVCQIAGRRQK